MCNIVAGFIVCVRLVILASTFQKDILAFLEQDGAVPYIIVYFTVYNNRHRKLVNKTGTDLRNHIPLSDTPLLSHKSIRSKL